MNEESPTGETRNQPQPNRRGRKKWLKEWETDMQREGLNQSPQSPTGENPNQPQPQLQLQPNQEGQKKLDAAMTLLQLAEMVNNLWTVYLRYIYDVYFG